MRRGLASVAWLALSLLASAVPAWGADLDAEIGRALFERVWVAAPASTRSSDGLGPLYNAPSCAACHPDAGRGPLADPNAGGITGLVLRLGIPHPETPTGARPDPVYGSQLQDRAVTGLTPEGRVSRRALGETLRLPGHADLILARADVRPAALTAGPLHPRTETSPRIAPQLRGLGLLERIPAADILAGEDPDDADGDGISGRANRVLDPATGRRTLGRFGWKASQASLDAQVQSAFAIDLGMAVPHHPSAAGDCTPRQGACLAAPHGGSPHQDGLEIDGPLIRMVTAFIAGLEPGNPPPFALESDTLEVSGPSDARVGGAGGAGQGHVGARVFMGIGCAACHRPSFRLPAQAGGVPRTIYPFTDLLLHDLGDGLADGLPEWDARGREWRTPPLWGLGRLAVRAERGETGLLHDGRARTLEEAILWHGGEAQGTRRAFLDLPAGERASLLAFLRAL